MGLLAHRNALSFPSQSGFGLFMDLFNLWSFRKLEAHPYRNKSSIFFSRKPAGVGKQAPTDAQASVPEEPPLAPEEVVWRQQILEWFQKHAFGQSIDCDFKLRHKVNVVSAII